MSNYSVQYKEYYEGLKKKNNINSSQNSIKNDDGIPIYRGSSVYTQNRKAKKESFLSNLIIMQLVGTMMLFLFAFGGRYSSNEDVKKYYTKFKAGIEEEYTYANAKFYSNDLELDSIKIKFQESIKWIQGKFTGDDFTY